jgi:hypothetical protein
MSPNEIVTDLRRQPFEPFRLVMTDGATYDIRNPDQCLVLATAVIVGLDSRPEQGWFERYEKLDCRHICRITYFPPAAAPPAGSGGPELTA